VGPDVLFIGGGTGGGKTTLARTLAAKYGLRTLYVDSFWYAHAERAGETSPPPDVQWLEWTPAKDRLYADRVAALARERGFLVLEVDGARRPEELLAESKASLLSC